MVRLPFNWAGRDRKYPERKKIIPQSLNRDFKNYYYILGVPPDSSQEQIKEAYNKLYEKFGPHVNISGQDPDLQRKVLNDINEACKVLMHPHSRKIHDAAIIRYFGKEDLGTIWKELMEKKSSD